MAFTIIEITAPDKAQSGSVVPFEVNVKTGTGRVHTHIIVEQIGLGPIHTVDHYHWIIGQRTYEHSFVMGSYPIMITVMTYYWLVDGYGSVDAIKSTNIELGDPTPPPEWVKVASDAVRVALVGGGEDWIQVASERVSVVPGTGAAGWYQVASDYASVYVGEPSEPSEFNWTWVVIGGAAVLAAILLIPGKKGPIYSPYAQLPPGQIYSPYLSQPEPKPSWPFKPVLSGQLQLPSGRG